MNDAFEISGGCSFQQTWYVIFDDMIGNNSLLLLWQRTIKLNHLYRTHVSPDYTTSECKPFRPRMKIIDWLRLSAALSLAVANSILPLTAGFGAVGAWILGTLLSIFLLSCAGVHRVRFTAIAVLPPFVVNRVSEINYTWGSYHTTRSPSESVIGMFPDTLLATLLAFAIFVAVPLAIALVTSRIAYKTRTV